ncbi:type VII secretion integral membrane protein EccD [Mycobacterium palustre]|uniref:type VII secretion integral membrane protein EccD n=1 Tax=Mycobacterium palustre TaxID=153971 RepID=UPI001FE390FF|nr:type VII secretion integral membrane protein EccD [Mycobacterium palustre]
MPASESGLRRVSVHAGTADVDLALPAEVPVAVLIPSIVDFLDGSGDCEAKRYQLFTPGACALDSSKTLAQNGIRDGDVLVLTHTPTPRLTPRCDDVAEAVASALRAGRAPGPRRRSARLVGAMAAGCLTGIGAVVLIRNEMRANGFGEDGAAAGIAAAAGVIALLGAAVAHRSYRDAMAALALSVTGIAFSAVAGLLTVPGGPGLPNALLAAAAAAATAVLAIRAVGCGVVALTAIACAATLAALAALGGVLTGAPVAAVGSVLTLTSLGLIGWAPRISLLLAGLSPRLTPPLDHEPADDLADKAFRAEGWLTGLVSAASSAAALGAVVTVLAGAPRPSCLAFGGLAGALLLARARSQGQARALVCAIGGTTVVAATFAVAASATDGRGAWITAATASLAAAAIHLGFVAPAVALPPALRRGAEILEWLALAAVVPLAAWASGLYSAVRGLSLT